MKRTVCNLSFIQLCRATLPAFVCMLLMAAIPVRAQEPCRLVVVGDFESRCVVPEKTGSMEELDEELVACQGMTVTYSVLPVPGNVTQWTWSVQGAASHTDNLDGTLTVVWGAGPAGLLTVTATLPGGDECSGVRRVRLVAPPEAHAESTPPYTVDALGQKVITLCAGSPLTFSDRSVATDGNVISGIYWRSSAGTASTEDYTLDPVTHADTVIHRAYNCCGCYDEERYIVRVVQGDTLGLGCYGTVCENATVTYTALNPASCTDYLWYVEGGTIVDGQYTPSVTVQWDRPRDGHGVIALDGSLCGGSACPTLLSRRIPVVQDRFPIEGPATVCAGATAEYSVPLCASTEYTWSVTPSATVQTHPVNGANKMRYVFSTAGTYTVRVTYRCGILGCGPYESEPLTVVVQPPLEVTGRSRICFHDACTLSTSPAATAQWRVHDVDNDTELPALAATGATFSTAAFPHAGRYRITAESPLHCRSAAFLLTVEAPPPTPAEGDLSPENPKVSCPYNSIHLQGTPSDPRYTLLWTPACTTAAPALVSGNSATVSYNAEVCDVEVYLFDRVTGCRSETPYVHTVAPFALASLGLPTTTVTACPGTLVSFNSTHVPWQKGVLYRWELQQTAQQYASIQGDATNNTVDIRINILNANIYLFYIDLIRDWCGGSDTHRVNFMVTPTPPSSVTVTPSFATVCPNVAETFTATGGNSSYVWYVDNSDGIPGISTWQWGSNQSGNHTIRAASSTYNYCDNEAYFASGTAQLAILPHPLYDGLEYDISTGRVALTPPMTPCPNCTYQWTLNGVTVPGATTDIGCQGQGTYACIVTDENGCDETYTLNMTIPCPGQCNPMDVNDVSFDYCTGTLTMEADSPVSTSWMVYGGEYEDLAIVSTCTATVKLKSIGTYTIVAYNGNPGLCYSGAFTKTVDFLPNFKMEAVCTTIVVRNRSKYMDGSRTVTVTLRSHASGTYIDSYTFQLSSPGCTFSPGVGTYDLYLTAYNGTSLNCLLGTVAIETYGSSNLSINTANTMLPTRTCDNIPIELTATLSGGVSVASVLWSFGDGSQLERNGASVYHTYKEGQNQYHLTATVTDEYGCIYNGTLNIESVHNDLKDGQIVCDPTLVCPYINQKELQYNNPYGNYLWSWSSGSTQVIPFYAFFTDNYYVRVRNMNYCLFQAMKNVPFLQHPTALITPENEAYCVDGEATFHGAPGPDSSQYTYTWSVTVPSNPPQTVPLAETTPTVTYTPQTTGTYTIHLKLVNSDGCVDNASYSFYVNPKPATPAVSYGGNRCIHTPPVVLQGSGAPDNLYRWSCGDCAATGYYFYPGRATAYYYDPATGCRSDTAGLSIEPAPDMDAVLSGCYEICSSFDRLKVWGITTFDQVIKWKWWKDGSDIANGYGNYLNNPMPLPIPGNGKYHLDADYDNNHCSVSSAPLEISQTDYCPCDSLDVKYTYTLSIKNCRLEYHVKVTLTNLSRRKRCLSSLAWIDPASGNSMTTDFVSQTLAPMDVRTFTVNLSVGSLLPTAATLRITDECLLCIKDILFDLVPPIACEADMDLTTLSLNTSLVSTAAAYFDFKFDLSPAFSGSPDALLAFWSEPPMVVDYHYAAPPYAQGLGMLDLDLLNRMAAQGQEICFHAIVCQNNTLCKLTYCIKAENLLELLYPPDPGEGKGTRAAGGADPETEVGLSPNPTAGDVEVTGTAGQVEEVVVMDMYGRQTARFEGTGTFDVSGLPAGSYIVRIKAVGTDGTKVYYRKLVKR